MQLERLDEATRALAKASTLEDIKKIEAASHGMENGIKACLKACQEYDDSGLEQQNKWAEIRIKAQRKGGELLAQLSVSPGKRTDLTLPTDGQGSTKKDEIEKNNLSRGTANRWQQIATVPVETFENHIQETKEKRQELTSASVLRLAQAEKRRQRHEDVNDIELSGKKYRVIYCDPPWRYNDSGVITENDNYGRAERHYPTMSLTQLKDLPIKIMTDDNAILFMWSTNPMLTSALELVDSWGFKYKTLFVWDKVKHNYGHYNSVRNELLLICTRGSCTPDNVKLFDSVQQIERSKVHSQKPEEFREIIDTLYTWGNKIELFARKRTSGWDAWGNQLSEITNS